MKNTSLTIKLFLKLNRIKSDGTASIFARVRYNRQKMEVHISKNIKPENWDDNRQKVYNHLQAKEINTYLESFKSKISNAHSQLFIAGKEITLESIKALVLGQAIESENMLIDLTEEHNAQFEALIGKKYSYGSYKNYKTTLKYLIEFVPQFYGKKDIPLTKVNYRFCEAYYAFLTTQKSCHTNGANKQLQRLKKFLNYAIKLGYIQVNPMLSYKLEFEPHHKIALTIEELHKLENLNLQREVLQNVRDVFLLQCYTGLSYSDVKRLSKEHLHEAYGQLWIKMNRQKTKTSFSVPLLSPAEKIIKRYVGKAGGESMIMPVLSNQKMNNNLKLIQELTGISKHLTTHLARHSFGTLMLNNGVPITSVSSMLGHTKLSTTQIYAKVQDYKIAEDMGKIDSILRND